jgi:predicted  nucleic acid-binding Zn-ribbon protein
VTQVQVDLAVLLNLQEKDRAVMMVEEQLNALQPEIEVLDTALAQAEEQLALAQKDAGDAEVRRAELEERIESYRVMQERRRQKLEWVRGAKEAATIMAELDLARTVLAKEEAEWIRSADKVQEAEHRLAEMQREVQETRETQEPTRQELAARTSELEAELAQARRERDEAAKQIGPDLLDLYQKILRGRAPQALYPLRGGACGHCFTSVPLHRRQQIQAGQSVEPCEACGVLVYNADHE